MGLIVHKTKLKAPLFLTVEKSHANWFAVNTADDIGGGAIYQGHVDIPDSKIINAYHSEDPLCDILDELGIEYNSPYEDGGFYCDELDEIGRQGETIADVVYLPQFQKWMKKHGKTAVVLSDVVENEEHKTYILMNPADFKIEKTLPGDWD